MSTIFATIHFDFSRIIILFMMGFGLGLIYNLTESLLYPIIIHILNNGIAFITFIMLKSQNDISFEKYLELGLNNEETLFQNSIILIIFIFFLIIWAIYIYNKIKRKISKF